MSLYDEIGGAGAIEAALDKFYPKILGDPRVSGLFDGSTWCVSRNTDARF